MNSASECRTFEELVPDFEDFFNQNLVDNPIGRWDLHRNENQAFFGGIDEIAPVASPVGLSPPSDFIQHHFALNDIICSMVNTRLSSYVEAYLTRLQAVHGQQLTVDQAILILRQHLPSINRSPYNPRHSPSPSIFFAPPVEVAPIPPDVMMTEPYSSAATPMEVPAVFDTEVTLEAYDLSSLRRIFYDGDRVKVECLWPGCKRTMMKDNHPRHIRECHLRAKRGVMRKISVYRKSTG